MVSLGGFFWGGFFWGWFSYCQPCLGGGAEEQVQHSAQVDIAEVEVLQLLTGRPHRLQVLWIQNRNRRNRNLLP